MKLAKKTYKSTQSHISFIYSILIDGVKTNHVFTLEPNNTCVVVDPDKQDAIEDSKYFKNGWLKIEFESDLSESDKYSLIKSQKKESKIVELAINDEKVSSKVQEAAQIKVETAEEKEEDILAEIEESVEAEMETNEVVKFEDVTNFQQVKDVLRSEPYNVPFQKLNTPGSILKVATELGLEFPNLK